MKKLVNLVLALVFGGTIPVLAAHELLYAITVRNDLISFYSDAPGAILSAHAITGLQGIEKIRGLDSWNGNLYGLGSYSQLYLIDPSTGAAMQVGAGLGLVLNGQAFGVDNGPSGMVILSDLRQNLTVNRTTGLATAMPALSYAARDLLFGVNPAVTGLAYDSATSKWYAADTLQNTLASFNPTTGVLSTIGLSGIDVSTQNGLNISSATGIMYLASPAASSDPQANLYTVNKATGSVTLVGQIGNPGDNILVRGLTEVTGSNAPSLSIALSGGNAVLSWSTNCPGYVLETTPSFKPTAWTVVPGTPATLHDQYVLSVSKTTSSQFFCLAACNAGAALSFDGATTYVSVGASALATPWTAEFWVNRQDAPSYSASLLGDDSTALKLEQFNYTRQVGFTWFGHADYTFNYSAPVGAWVHLAFVSDTTTRLYVNGVLQDTIAATIPLPLGQIGYDSSGYAEYVKGILDEVRVWNVARTQAQIQAGMNHSLSLPQANLVGYWKFDEGNGTSAFDSSGQGKTGTLQGPPVWVISTAPLVP